MNRSQFTRFGRDPKNQIIERVQKDLSITRAVIDYKRLIDDLEHSLLRIEAVKIRDKRAKHTEIIKKNCNNCFFFKVGVCRFSRILFLPDEKEGTCKNYLQIQEMQ